MDFDQLETFLEVARLSSFSRAAEKRFRTQPAISSQIRGLEEEVGAKLLDRSGGKVSLTASGKAVSEVSRKRPSMPAKPSMTAIAETERVPRGEIMVGANEGTCLHILPEVFADFKKQYPDVSVNINRADYAKILESVIDNSVDFGVLSLPVTDPRLTVVLIHRDELIIIAPPQHPLAKLKSATIADVAQYPLVVPKVGPHPGRARESFPRTQAKTADTPWNWIPANCSSVSWPPMSASDLFRARTCRKTCAQSSGRDSYCRRAHPPRPGFGVPQRQSPQPGGAGIH